MQRFIFSSSCSNYGAGGDDLLDEHSAFNPVTPYGTSKVMVEQDVAKLADNTLQPNVSPQCHRLRCFAPVAL